MSNWIKCSDRLPDDGVCVIGSGWMFGDKAKGRWVEPTIYSKEDLDFHPVASDEYGDLSADFDSSMVPTHWQPLPAPPAE
jgi:hypothetical protein